MDELQYELKLWESRKNDNFGSLVNHINDVTKEDVLPSYTDGFGIERSIIKNILAGYMLDGNAQLYLNYLKEILTEYDICNFEEPDESNYPELTKEILEFENSLN